MIRATKETKGMTLMEVMVGMVIIMIAAMPLFQFTAKVANASKVTDMRVAYALLRGEVDIMYKSRVLPPPGRTVCVAGLNYGIVFESQHREGDMVTWTMKVKKNTKLIAGIRGLLYVPWPGNN